MASILSGLAEVKFVSLAAIVVFSLVGSFIPLYLKSSNEHSVLLQWSELFTTGIFLGVGLLHLLPSSVEGFDEAFNLQPQLQPFRDFPWAYAGCALGFVCLWFIERHMVAHHQDNNKMRLVAITAGAESCGGASVCFVNVEPVASYGPVVCEHVPPTDEGRSAKSSSNDANLSNLRNNLPSLLQPFLAPAPADGKAVVKGNSLLPVAAASADDRQLDHADNLRKFWERWRSQAQKSVGGASSMGKPAMASGHTHAKGRGSFCMDGTVCHVQAECSKEPKATAQQEKDEQSLDLGNAEPLEARQHDDGDEMKLLLASSTSDPAVPAAAAAAAAITASCDHHHAGHHLHEHEVVFGPSLTLSHSHGHQKHNAAWTGVAGGSIDDECEALHRHAHSADHHHILIDGAGSMSYFLAIILSFHSFVEGCALGAAMNLPTAVSLIIALLAHKWAETFSIAMQFVKEKVPMGKMVAVMLLYCTVTPLGILVGGATFFLHDITAKLLASSIQAFGAGTVLCIVMLQLGGQHQHGSAADAEEVMSSSLQVILLLAGLLLMAAVAVFV